MEPRRKSSLRIRISLFYFERVIIIGDIDSYKQLILLEQETFYLLKFIDINNKTKVIKFLKNDSDIKKMLELLKLYIQLYKVNGFNHFKPIYSVGYKVISLPKFFLANDQKNISLKVNVQLFRIISEMVLADYVKNRELFCKTTEVKEIRINASSNDSKFYADGNVVNLTLEADSNMNIKKYDREFFASIINDRCFGKKIDVNLFKEKNKNYYVAVCDEFKFSFPRDYTYSVLMQIINNHNEEIDKLRKRR